jgi:NADH-quinone oxidoreductase subunit D
MTPPVWGFEEREKLMIFYERASGARLHAAYFRPGGVHQDLPPELVEDIGNWCDPFLKILDDIESLLTGNRIFKQRNVDIGVVSLADAWSWCAVPVPPGTCARRSPTNVMPTWISTFRSARTATVSTVT